LRDLLDVPTHLFGRFRVEAVGRRINGSAETFYSDDKRKRHKESDEYAGNRAES
jgi:hypothetical protein